MKIAKIVSSNSHIDYVGRVIDELDASNPPQAEDYGFGQFVSVSLPETRLVGVIYNSVLLNPEYANFGPRLSSKPSLETFSPDFLNEQGVLLSVLIVGAMNADGSVIQTIPRRVVPPGETLESLETEQLKVFHSFENGLQIKYYSQIIDHTGVFAFPLLETIIATLSIDCSEAERRQLAVLKETLIWQRTIGAAKL